MPPEKIPYLKPYLSTSKQIAKLKSKIEPQFNFKEKLDFLINNYQIETFRMGFPNNWQNLPVWSEKE